MIVLGYSGNNPGDTWITKAARAITRWVQKGSIYQQITHVENHLDGPWYSARIGSSSFKDKGVRVKDNVKLHKGNWIALDVPLFKVDAAEKWLYENRGKHYDLEDAISTVLWLIKQKPDKYICVEAVAIPQGIVDAHQLTTAEFMAFCASLPGTKDVTEQFFSEEPK